jgi:hypothetical protein
MADTLQEAVFLIAQFTSNGGGELTTAQMMQRFQDRFGKRWRPFYDDFRRAEDPESVTVTPRRFPSDRPGRPNPSVYAMPDAGSITARDAVVGGTPSQSQLAAARARLAAGAVSTALPAGPAVAPR